MKSVVKNVGAKVVLKQACGDQLPIVWRLIFINCHRSLDLGCLIDGGLISTINLATKFGMHGNKM
jgi:hypothetical protein